MAVVLFPNILQLRLDSLNQALHNAHGERTATVQSMEQNIRNYVGNGITLVYMEDIGEYGLFSSNEPYIDDPV